MAAAGEVFSHPELYRIATATIETVLKVLPRFAIYNDFNAWGKHREIPLPAGQTFREWFKENRMKKEKE